MTSSSANDRMGTMGKLFDVNGNNQKYGTIFDINGYSLIHGAGLRLTGGGSSFKHGNLLRLYSSAPDPTTGVVRVLANAVNTGNIMKLSMDEIGNGTGIHITSGNGTSMNTSGVLVDIDVDSQVSGTMFDISALGLVNGSAVKITSGDKIMELETTTSKYLSNGAFRILSDSIEYGSVWRISGDSFKLGNMIDIETSSRYVEKKSKIMKLHAHYGTKGTMIDIHGSELSKGRLYTMGARSIETGMYFEIADTPYLSNGNLLNIKTSQNWI